MSPAPRYARVDLAGPCDALRYDEHPGGWIEISTCPGPVVWESSDDGFGEPLRYCLRHAVERVQGFSGVVAESEGGSTAIVPASSGSTSAAGGLPPARPSPSRTRDGLLAATSAPVHPAAVDVAGSESPSSSEADAATSGPGSTSQERN